MKNKERKISNKWEKDDGRTLEGGGMKYQNNQIIFELRTEKCNEEFSIEMKNVSTWKIQI